MDNFMKNMPVLQNKGNCYESDQYQSIMGTGAKHHPKFDCSLSFSFE